MISSKMVKIISLFFRFGILTATSLASFSHQSDDTVDLPFNVAWGLLVVPCMILFVLGIQYFNLKKVVWLKPSWYLFPLNPYQPLQFFHFGAYFFLANSAGYFLSAILSDGDSVKSLVLFVLGMGLYIGVYISIFLFRKKIVQKVKS